MHNQPIADYLPAELEDVIVASLRLFAETHAGNEQAQLASDYADALENDTWLLETTEPKES